MKDGTPQINLQRLRDDLEGLARIGFDPRSGGVSRPGLSDADIQARRWLIECMRDAGMDAELDAAANVIGRWNGGAPGPALAMGSHLDTVPQGGMFDGALGVMAGVEVVRSMRDAGIKPRVPIEVIATSEEEGRFGGMMGAQALVGELSTDWLTTAVDHTGTSLTDALRRQGLDPERVLTARRPRDSLLAFLELHVEQGPVLENEGIPIGIVEGIAGVFHWTIALKGQPNHAGTTPMDLRRDAFMALADFAHQIPRIIRQHGSENGRLTVGKVDVGPGFPHTVPGSCEFTLVGKDFENDDLKNLATGCRAALNDSAGRHRVDLDIHEASFLDSQPCDPEIVSVLEHCADELQLPSKKMYSGAGHDTQIFARHTRSGMIFVPSIGGISHSPGERTEWADIEKGARLLLHAALKLGAGS